MLSFDQCLSTVVQSLPSYLSDLLESVQKRALNIIYPNLCYMEALSISGCIKLSERRLNLCSKVFSKICSPSHAYTIFFFRLEVVFIIVHYVIVMNYPYISIELNGLNEVFPNDV